MRKSILIIFILGGVFYKGHSQGASITLGGGIMNYQGDLQSSRFTFKQAQQAINLIAKYDFENKFIGRAGFTFGSVYADDKFNSSPQKERNLNFRSKIAEFQVGLEYHFFSSEERRLSPYVFGGVAVYHFNPYTFDNRNRLTFLKPFSTEGEGLPEYPDRKPYSLTQGAIPFGVGVNYRISCMFSIGVEFTERKLFTDYLDDVSKGYVDGSTLLKEKGPTALELAYRAGPYPTDIKNAYHRGNPSNKDWYYTGMITISYHFNNCITPKMRPSLYGCPLPM